VSTATLASVTLSDVGLRALGSDTWARDIDREEEEERFGSGASDTGRSPRQ